MTVTHEADGVLYQSPQTRVIQGLRSETVGDVVRKEGVGEDCLDRIRHEREILARLAGVPGVPELVTEDPQLPSSITMADAHGVPLLAAIDPGDLDPGELLRLARDLAAVVSRIHERGVVHKDINPNNVLLVEDSRELVLIDFDLATTFAQEHPGFTSQREISGTLPYLAPEQTGRTGRPVGPRADLYSLGATLYHLATGDPPFGSDDDALRLVRDHLARIPEPPQARNPALPTSLSQIIMRLLEKEPDRRYQSARGLVHDLELALHRWTDGVGEPFPLGERDFPLRLAPPTQLVGRDEQIRELKEAFDQAVAGKLRGVLLAGTPGVGKTSLMNELRPVVTASDGWFVSGKFDQYSRGQASDAVAQCVGALGLLLLAEAESEAELAALKTRIKAAVGPNAAILVGVVPELAHLLDLPAPGDDTGPAAAAVDEVDVDPFDAERRLHQSGLDFLRAVAGPSRPLVLVMDDLQWGTGTPIGFLDQLLTAEDLPGVLVVGAYRDSEVDAAHPLSGMLATWQALDTPARHITLTNLPPDDLEVFLAKMLRLSQAPPASLTTLVQSTTGGNPFDTVELLNALRRDGVLSLGPDGWVWDETANHRRLDGEDVTDLVNARIDALPPTTVATLEAMSLLGGEVQVEVLQAAAGLSRAELSERLRPALEDGLLLMESGTAARVHFAHDRVHQAARTRIPPDRGGALRLALARALAPLPSHQARAAELYRSADEITDPAERQLAATLMHQAAERQALASPVSALGLLDAALKLHTPELHTPEPMGEPDRFLGEIQAGRHTALYRQGRLEEADEAFADVDRCFPQVLDRVPTARNQINSLCNRGRYAQALDLGMDLLVELGIDRPGEDLGTAVNEELDRVLEWLRTADPAAERARPACTDPRIQAIASVCHGMVSPGFFVNPMLSFWVTLLSLKLWSEHGPSPANYGTIGFVPVIVTSLREDYRAAMQLHDIIMNVGYAHGFDDHMYPSRFQSLLIEHWFDPLAQDLDKARDTRTGLLKAGEIQFVSFTNTISAAAAWEFYPTLGACRAEIESGLAFARRIGDNHCAEIFETYLSPIRALQSGDEATTDSCAPDAGPTSPMATCFLHINQALQAALLADLPACAQHAAAALPLLPAIDGHHHITWAHTLHALSTAWRIGQAEQEPQAQAPEPRALLPEVDEHLGWLQRRAEDNPDDFTHLAAWIRAERAAAVGDLPQATRSFDEALVAIRRHERIWHHALISERAGRFHLAQGHQHIAGLLLAEAWQRYQDWGATAKAEQLDSQFPGMSFPGTAAYQASATIKATTIKATTIKATTIKTGTIKGTTGGARSLADIDLLAILRASQTLSLETHLDRLQSRIVEVLEAMTGATGVQLLLWSPESHGWMLSSSAELPRPIDLERPGEDTVLPLSALRYADRTRSPLLVEDATRDPRFSRDPYFAGLEQCSLLVLPVQKQGQPLAMLMIENRLSGGALTADRLDTLMLISGQLAISIDNALAERFRSVVQYSTDLTLVCNSRHLLTYASAASADLLGSANVTLLGRGVLELFHEDDRPELDARLQGMVRDASKPLECRIVAADGTLRWVEVAFTNLLGDPAVNGLVLRLRDVTERRALETQLRHSQKMQSIGVLASGIAHEINTPVQYVITNLQYLSEACGELITQAEGAATPDPAAPGHHGHDDLDDLREEVPQAIAEAIEGVSRVATIVQAMKSFGHPGEEKMTPSDLNEAVRNTVLVAGNEIKYVADVELDLQELPPVHCTLGDIKQVLLNLVVNAAHAIKQARDRAPGRGRITIRTRHVDQDVVIEVEDTGTGISPDIADRVFDQFFTTKEVGVGTGQGLSLAYTLVHDRHHGALTFTSEPGTGTTFTVRLPVRQPAASPH